MTLVDTGPLVALCDPRDAAHKTAVDDLRSLALADFILPEAVLVEAAFHLSHAAQRQRLRAFIRELHLQPPDIDDDERFRSDVFEWLAKYAEHEPDLADGCLAVLSERHREARVWTFDREFRTTWRRPGGSAIPTVKRAATK